MRASVDKQGPGRPGEASSRLQGCQGPRAGRGQVGRPVRWRTQAESGGPWWGGGSWVGLHSAPLQGRPCLPWERPQRLDRCRLRTVTGRTPGRGVLHPASWAPSHKAIRGRCSPSRAPGQT